ncbi:geranylgeranylglycerol-phosphate geranylgeranyltransferase [Ascidiimonas aurantiaca]|uniref:geranylgeranylglycerol-phosphate geranylgeranyltransferase n=1 Tax=Ascidiimonas aurantiaca TaxID=1685432 RepID=UPI0030ECEBD3
MLNYLKLVRFPNLCMIALTQWVIKLMLINVFFKHTTLSFLDFTLLVLATVCIAAAGYIINDIHDVAIDQINKPDKQLIGKKIKLTHAYNTFFLLNIIGVALGFYIAFEIERSGFAVIFVLVSGLLYLYATMLKPIPLIGNLTVCISVAISILLPFFFDVVPVQDISNRWMTVYVLEISLCYAGFAFFISFIRELVKSIEDIDGDYNNGIRSVPMLIGKKRTSRVTALMALSMVLILFYIIYQYLYHYTILNAYILFGIMGPLFYFTFTSWEAKKKKHFTRLSQLLKVIMLAGVISLVVFRYTVLNDL